MSLSKNITSYEDVRSVLDAALSAGGARVPFSTPGQATYWNSRANMLRRLQADRDGSTPWDGLSITRRDNVVLILPRVVPEIQSLDGEPLAPADDYSDLLDDAKELKRRLNLE